jgi:hypothetical protein
MLLKNYGMRNVVFTIPMRAVYDFCKVFENFKKNDQNRGIVVFKAWLWNLDNFKLVWKKRLYVQQIRKVSDDYLISRALIAPDTRLLKLFDRLIRR